MKAIIYLRTSTTEQHPENQKDACLQFCINKGYDVYDIYYEQISGFKDVTRPKYEAIKELARSGKVQAVVVWALDRWIRNRDTLLSDVIILRNYGCKLHSVQEAWLEAINIDGSLGATIQDFLLGLIGSLAEMESKRKSERVKLAFQSHKGSKWGRTSLPETIIKSVLNLNKQGKSIRQISQEAYYWDANNNKKFISKSAVHKIIAENKHIL
jgi:DNA invertase Pin-like site-specific DNA recombinase